MFEQLKDKGKIFRAGQILFNERETSDEMYFIIEGAVEILKMTGEEETCLAIFGKGDIFGEMAFFDNEPRSATARALVNSQILVISRTLQERQLKTLPAWFNALIRIIIKRLRHTNERLATFLLKDKISQISSILIDTTKSFGKMRGSESVINFGLAKKFMAKNLGVTIDEAEDGIAHLTERQLARIEGTQLEKQLLVIPNISKLQDFVDYLEKKEKLASESNPKLEKLISSDKNLHMLGIILRIAQKIGRACGNRLVLDYEQLKSELESTAGHSTNYEEILGTLEDLLILIVSEKEAFLEKVSLEKIVNYSYLKKEFYSDAISEQFNRERQTISTAPAPLEKTTNGPPFAPHTASGESYNITLIPKEKLEPGMVIASPIYNNTDKVILFKEGAALTPEAIGQILKMPHIFDVEIKGDLRIL